MSGFRRVGALGLLALALVSMAIMVGCGGNDGDLLPGVTAASLDVRANVGGVDEEAEIAAPASPTPLAPGTPPGLGP
jgi:hypothetical protein